MSILTWFCSTLLLASTWLSSTEDGSLAAGGRVERPITLSTPCQDSITSEYTSCSYAVTLWTLLALMMTGLSGLESLPRVEEKLKGRRKGKRRFRWGEAGGRRAASTSTSRGGMLTVSIRSLVASSHSKGVVVAPTTTRH